MLSVSATGPGTLSYKWMKDGKTLADDNITGVGDPILHINNFSQEHDGEYTCVISNGYCTLTSNPHQLKGTVITLIDPKLIHLLTGRNPLKLHQHPQTQCKVYGDEVALTVSATGAGTISYQWMKDEEAIEHDQHPIYTGTNTNMLLIGSFSAEYIGQYWCKVSNEDSILYSNTADLQGICRNVYAMYM